MYKGSPANESVESIRNRFSRVCAGSHHLSDIAYGKLGGKGAMRFFRVRIELTVPSTVSS